MLAVNAESQRCWRKMQKMEPEKNKVLADKMSPIKNNLKTKLGEAESFKNQ